MSLELQSNCLGNINLKAVINKKLCVLVVTTVRGFSNRSPTPNSRPSSADSTSGQLTAPQFHVSVSGLKGREKLVRPAKIANKN